MGSEFNINMKEEIYIRLLKISKTLNIDKQKLVDLAFEELFDLIINEPSIFLERMGIIDNLKEILSEE